MRNHSRENDFDLHENETAYRTHFHMKGFTLRLVLKQRHKRTRKWLIRRKNSLVATLHVPGTCDCRPHDWLVWKQLSRMMSCLKKLIRQYHSHRFPATRKIAQNREIIIYLCHCACFSLFLFFLFLHFFVLMSRFLQTKKCSKTCSMFILVNAFSNT